VVVLLAVAVVFPMPPLAARTGLAAAPAATIATPITTATATAARVPVAEPTLPQHYVVLIVVDAGRASYYSLTRLPHIRALMQRGVVYDRAWVGELESSTPNVHVTYGTGTLPRENGFLGFGWAAPQTRQTIDFRALLANRAIDPVLQALPVPSVAARLHQYIPDGHKDYAVVGLGGGAATYELYGKFVNHTMVPSFMHSPPPLTQAERQSLVVRTPLAPGKEDDWAVKYTLDVVRHVRPRLLMINLPDLDTWGHWNGPADTKLFGRLMANVDTQIGQIEATYQQLGVFNRTDFIVTADHAMMESRAAHNWRTVQNVANAVGTTVARADGEGGSIWLQDPSKAKAMALRLAQLKPAHVEAIFYRSAPGLDYTYLRASPTSWLVNPQVAAALQYLVNTTAGRNGPDVWALYRENYSVVPRNVDGTWKGTHGGATWKVQHVPLVMAGSGIRQGAHSQFPARAVDITPTLEYLLGLPAVHRDGVLLADALTAPSKGERAAQSQLSSLGAYVTALQAQSAADDRGYRSWSAPPPPVRGCHPSKGSPHNSCTITPSPTDE
jgi:arylsulfatase A-like enzyme